ncbi:MAG: hypothetical protein K1X83_12050 [Oligoflexia bacterium]|nr:hypothetical protein [Oligoflexia bacterium]
MSYAKAVIGAGLMLLLPACTAKPVAPPREPIANTHTEQQLPYDLVIFEELNDGHKLYLDGELRGSAAIDPARTLLRLSLLNDGDELRHEVFPLTRIARESGIAPKPGEPYPFVISAETGGATNYQIELLWGEEAEAAMTELQGERSKTLELTDLEIRECPSDDDCDIPFLILGRLVNTGNDVVQSVELAVGFALSSAETAPVSEEKMQLDHLDIKPGQSKPLRLTLDRPMSAAQRKHFTPTVRVVSVS